MEKKTQKVALTTMVKIINWEPIIEVFSKQLGRPVEIRVGNGYIGDIKMPRRDSAEIIESLIIDKECCEVQSVRKNMFIPDCGKSDIMSAKMFEGIGVFEKSETGIAMFPSFYVDIDEDEIIKNLTGEEMNLKDFMGDRYSYNSRVKSNEIQILKAIYHNKPEVKIHEEA